MRGSSLEPDEDLYVDLDPGFGRLAAAPLDQALFQLAAQRRGLGNHLFERPTGDGAERTFPELPVISYLALRLESERATFYRTGTQWDGPVPDERDFRAPKTLSAGYYVEARGSEPSVIPPRAGENPELYRWIAADWAVTDPRHAGYPLEVLLKGQGIGGGARKVEELTRLLSDVHHARGGVEARGLNRVQFEAEHRAWLRHRLLPPDEAAELNLRDVLRENRSRLNEDDRYPVGLEVEWGGGYELSVRTVEKGGPG